MSSGYREVGSFQNLEVWLGVGGVSRLASHSTGSTSHRRGESIAHFLDKQTKSKSHSKVGQKHLTRAAKRCPEDISLAPVDPQPSWACLKVGEESCFFRRWAQKSQSHWFPLRWHTSGQLRLCHQVLLWSFLRAPTPTLHSDAWQAPNLQTYASWGIEVMTRNSGSLAICVT